MTLTLREPDWFYAFVPRALAGGREPNASTADLAQTLFDPHRRPGAVGFFATFLFTHNAQIAILAFALGFACCLPTAFLMFYNGLMLGAFCRPVRICTAWASQLGGWLLIHGVTELFAVTLAGAAGFRIGWALAFPGEQIAAGRGGGRRAQRRRW